jgi:hypothetical protein
LLERKLGRNLQRIPREPIAHRHHERARLSAHRRLDARHHAVRRVRGAGRRLLERQCTQEDVRMMLGVEERGPQHVATRAFPGALGHLGRKVRAELARAQLLLIDRERVHRDADLEARAPHVGGNVDRAGEGVRGDHVVVPGARKCPAAVHEYAEERGVRDHLVGSALVGCGGEGRGGYGG